MGKIWGGEKRCEINRNQITKTKHAYLNLVVGHVVDVAKERGVRLDVVEHPAKLLHQAGGHDVAAGVQQVLMFSRLRKVVKRVSSF